MGEIVKFNGYTKLDIDPNDVLSNAIDQTKQVLVIGNSKDGSLYVAASTADGGELLWLIETFKHKLMSGDFHD